MDVNIVACFSRLILSLDNNLLSLSTLLVHRCLDLDEFRGWVPIFICQPELDLFCRRRPVLRQGDTDRLVSRFVVNLGFRVKC